MNSSNRSKKPRASYNGFDNDDGFDDFSDLKDNTAKSLRPMSSLNRISKRSSSAGSSTLGTIPHSKSRLSLPALSSLPSSHSTTSLSLRRKKVLETSTDSLRRQSSFTSLSTLTATPTRSPSPSSLPTTLSLSSGPRKSFYNDSFKSLDSSSPKIKIEPTSPVSMKTREMIKLNEDQRKTLTLALSGQNLFFTGAAGTGKSVLLRTIISQLRAKYDNPNSVRSRVAVTASTGLAAMNIGGETLHKFAGCGLATGKPADLVSAINRSKLKGLQWREAKVLIIDEISMVDGVFFDKLDYIAKQLRRNESKPFGGIQIICTGDFFQLPPVAVSGQRKQYVFESNAWKTTIQNSVILTQVYRQQGDNTLIQILNSMRTGKLTQEMDKILYSLSRPVSYPDGIAPTELYATKVKVQTANQSYLSQLSGPIYIYESNDTSNLGNTPERRKAAISRLDESLLALRELYLRRNCQVMAIKNMSADVVNGSVGKVIAFLTMTSYQAILTNASRNGIPKDSSKFEELLIEAEQKDIMNEKLAINSKSYNAPTMTTKQDPKTPRGNHSIQNFMRPTVASTASSVNSSSSNNPKNSVEIRYRLSGTVSPNIRLPVIKFSINNGAASFIEHMGPTEFSIMGKGNSIECSRIQIPLVLSWAMSIHKAQGQTLDRVKVDLANIFENGHAYVALSRATAKERLQVLNYNPRKVTVDSKVIQFYKDLENGNNSGYATPI